MGKYFGTDGVRGIANDELTVELATALGKAVVHTLGTKSPKVLVGRDTRVSGTMLEAALSAGITSMGGQVFLAEVIPTPAVAYLTKKYGMDTGVVISASHNPYADNGIKFFDGNGFKFNEDKENEIEKYIEC
jgi:phosphoglucosamine mutase